MRDNHNDLDKTTDRILKARYAADPRNLHAWAKGREEACRAFDRHPQPKYAVLYGRVRDYLGMHYQLQDQAKVWAFRSCAIVIACHFIPGSKTVCRLAAPLVWAEGAGPHVYAASDALCRGVYDKLYSERHRPCVGQDNFSASVGALWRTLVSDA